MVWDYRYGGKVYKNLRLVFFIAYLKTDTEEADKLCGKFLSRGSKVAQLCRYCTCPNDETDSCIAKYPYKTETMIRSLCRRNHREALRKLSQHCMDYALHGIRFGQHNARGIHGACPIEILHMILLGLFKYVKEAFFVQLGASGVAAQEINALCTWIGKLFARQSDRDLPKTQFGNGILKGKLMGKEMSGVLLLLAAVLQTSLGKELLKSGRGSKFKDQVVYDDWVLLIETMLEWEAYLKEEQMDVAHVKCLEKKHRYIMYLIKKVVRRTEGMGLKLVKFHAILHLAEDILMFGVPSVVDTGHNEEHHKTTKGAAKLTQRDVRVFERQTAKRLVEFHLLDLAEEEIESRPIWDYYERKYEVMEEYQEDMRGNLAQSNKNETKGTQIGVYTDEDSGAPRFKFCNSRICNQEKVQWDVDVVTYLVHLQEHILERQLDIFTEHRRNGTIFRAHPNYRQLGHWNDWVQVDWGPGGKQPCQIWCFIDLRRVPHGFGKTVDGVRVQKGVFAVVESADYEQMAGNSDLFIPCIKECRQLDNSGNIAKRQFYLADVEAFLHPVTVIPDVGSENKLRYLQVKARKEWADCFLRWVKDPHDLDEMDDEFENLEEDSEEEESDSGDEESDSEEEESDSEEEESDSKEEESDLEEDDVDSSGDEEESA